MYLTMIDPATILFEILELPMTENPVIPMDSKGEQGHKGS